QSAPRNAGEREKFNQIAAEEEELRETEASLLRQQSILERQEADLIVRSPLDGQVVTWDVQELLAARPVQRGQQLLTVADLRGPWILEIDVPDERIGPVLAARRTGPGAPLPVSFMLATEPGTTYLGRVSQIAVSAEPDPRTGQRVRVTVDVPAESAVLRRPGAVVVPRIHCGRFPLGYVWFHTAWESIQKHVLF
ncbi:MAG: HlyD family secretion protein, partial [Planctomycetaceae bacterium]